MSQAGIRPAIAAQARRLEAKLPGERASEEEWSILLGQRGGSLSWADDTEAVRLPRRSLGDVAKPLGMHMTTD